MGEQRAPLFPWSYQVSEVDVETSQRVVVEDEGEVRVGNEWLSHVFRCVFWPR